MYMYAAYKMQMLTKNGSPLSSLHTCFFAKLNHTGKALHKGSIQFLSCRYWLLCCQGSPAGCRQLCAPLMNAHLCSWNKHRALVMGADRRHSRLSASGKVEEAPAKHNFWLGLSCPWIKHLTWLSPLKNVICNGFFHDYKETNKRKGYRKC